MGHNQTMYKFVLFGALLVGLVYSDHHDEVIQNDQKTLAQIHNLPEACRIPPDTTDCGSPAEDRWFYHPNLRACSKFTYKGCIGKSANNFLKKENCERLCLPSFENVNGETEENKKVEDVKETNEKHLVKSENNKDEEKVKSQKEPITNEESGEKEDVNQNVENDLITNKESEVSNNEDANKSDNEETTDKSDNKEDDEEIEDTLKEQDEVRNRFNMATSDDMLTLQEYLQDRNMEMAEILTEEELGGNVEPGDIRARLYQNDDEAEDVTSNNEGEPNFENVEHETIIKDEAEDVTAKAEGINKNKDLEEDDEESDDEMQAMQSNLQDRFGMANANDMLTLQDLVQDPKMELQDIELEEDDEHTYKNEDDAIVTVPEVNLQNLEVAEEKKEENTDNQDDDEDDIERQVEEEAHLEQMFNMADADDMLALQDIVQAPQMDVQELSSESSELKEHDANGDRKPDEPKPVEQYEQEPIEQQQVQEDVNNNESEDEDDLEDQIKQEDDLRKQFGMADSDDMLTLQDMIQHPNMETQSLVNNEEGVSLNKDTEEPEADYKTEYAEETVGDDRFGIAEDYNMYKNMEASDGSNRQGDSYGEHLDHTATENKDGGQEAINEEDVEDEETIRFQEGLEHQFNMADRDDILSLQQMLQEPGAVVQDVIEADKAGAKQEGDINGVLDLATSLLKEEDSENNFKELRQDMADLPEMAKETINDATGVMKGGFEYGNYENVVEGNVDNIHPAEKLMQENNVEGDDKLQVLNTENMSHEDKMMLISVLHLDNLKVHQPLGLKLPEMKPMFKKFFRKGMFGKKTPKEDFFSVMKINGIRKCCLLPKDPGPCKDGSVLQWHYDPFIKTCLPFYYGGCKGNRNRFDTIGECLRKCGNNNMETEKSLPEPIPEPPTFNKSPIFGGFKSMISKILPSNNVVNLKEKMTPGQQKFIHKFIKTALKHIGDIKPVKIAAPFLANAFSSLDNRIMDNGKQGDTKPSVPLKSIMFKWPILKMVFDRRNKELSNRMEARRERMPPPPHRMPVIDFMGHDKFMPLQEQIMGHIPREFRRGRDESAFFREFGKRGDHDRNGKDEQFRGRKPNKHFSPSFKKSYKMMSRHEDNRHQISSDPKNKVNLIQVFVNKPSAESQSSPVHHHTVIKKHFSPEPQIKPPMPPAPPVNRNTPPQGYMHYAQARPQQEQSSPNKPVNHRRPHPPPPPPHSPHSPHFNHNHETLQPHEQQPPYSHSHPHSHGNYQPHEHNHQHNHPHPPQFERPHTHYHVHHPQAPPPHMMHSPHVFPPHHGGPPQPRPIPFFNNPHVKPWWSRFDRPYVEQRRMSGNGERSSERFHPHIRPSTGYSEKDFEEGRRRYPSSEESDDNRDVIVVTVPPGGDDDELHYSCLLPVSTGMCKAYEEKYFFNLASGECEMFVYGGCGGNANNYGSKEECLATCVSTSPVPTHFSDTTTLPDDTIIVTSPVYVPDGSIVESEQEVKKVETTDAKEIMKEDVVEEQHTNEDKHVVVEHESVKVEPVSLFKSSNTEYIIVIAVMCFVGLAVVALVALAIVNMSRRNNVTKKERVLEAVLSSHLERSNSSLSGTITPRSNYYGQPPSEMGPPPISDIPKLHQHYNNKETMDEHL